MNLRNKAKNIRLLRLFVYKVRMFREKIGYIKGKKNIIINNGIKISTHLCIKGSNNSICIDEKSVLLNCSIKILGNNARIHLKKNCYVEGATLFIEDNDCSIIIGENTFIGPSHLAATENKSTILIGDDCMLSSNIYIRTGDSHSIIDTEKKLRINFAQNIVIGDHCWIGEGVKILKGVSLANDVIVASGAIVTKSFNSNVLVGGIPAKIIKDKVSWDENRLK